MDWIYKLERKFSRYAIPGIVNYIVAGQVLVFLAMFFINASFGDYTALWRAYVLQGQVWRLVTFVFYPLNTSPLWFAISAYFYYFVGKMLEFTWGSFRLNLYIYITVLGAIAAAMLTGYASNSYLLLSLYLAYAMLYPEREVLLFFVLPVKVKWMGWISGGFCLLAFLLGGLGTKVNILCSMAGFLVFFGKDFWNAARAKVRRERWRHRNRKNWR
ncbi:MAG: Rhomboid family protein [Faecalibacterium sp.]